MDKRKILNEKGEEMHPTKWSRFAKKPVEIRAYQTDREVFIETLEGTMKANKGDWIIEGIKGELYPCKPDIFEATYEEVIYYEEV